jgi:hypothetical protein
MLDADTFSSQERTGQGGTDALQTLDLNTATDLHQRHRVEIDNRMLTKIKIAINICIIINISSI